MTQVMYYPAVRFSLAGILALIVTSLLFYLMQSLIKNGSDKSLGVETPGIILSYVRVDEPEQKPRSTKPERLPETLDPPPIPQIDSETKYNPTGTGTEVTVIPPPIEVEPGPGTGGGLSEGEMLPMVKVQPVYPVLARRRGIEGYVIVEFTVTAYGTTRDIRVVEARPSGIFDQAAIAAATRFKYKPRVINGQGVEVTGVQNLFTFVLEN